MAVKEKRRRARGEGGLTQRPDGLWVGKVELPPDPVTGKRRDARVSSMVQSEAVKKLNKMKRDLADRGDLPSGTTTLAKYITYWLNDINQSRPKTRAGYRSKIEQYIIPAIGKIKLDKLSPDDVRKLESYIVDTKKLSPTSALQAYQILKKALKDAERENRVTRNVATLVDPPRKAVPKLKILTVDEAIKVIGSVTEARLGSRVAMALLTGARQGETLGLEWDRIDFGTDDEPGTVDLSWQLQRIAWRHGSKCRVVGQYESGKAKYECARPRGTDCPTRRLDAPADWEHRHMTGGLYLSRPKSKAGWRVIPLVEPLHSILIRRREASELEPNPHGLVWTADEKQTKNTHVVLPLDGTPVDPSRDNKAWHSVLEAAGVTDVRLHDARHTAVTLLYELGVPETVIQDIVGQSTISTTRGYRHKSQKPLIEALRALGGVLDGRLAIAASE